MFWENVLHGLIDPPPNNHNEKNSRYIPPTRTTHSNGQLRKIDIPEANDGTGLLDSGSTINLRVSSSFFTLKSQLASPLLIFMAISEYVSTIDSIGSLKIPTPTGMMEVHLILPWNTWFNLIERANFWKGLASLSWRLECNIVQPFWNTFSFKLLQSLLDCLRTTLQCNDKESNSTTILWPIPLASTPWSCFRKSCPPVSERPLPWHQTRPKTIILCTMCKIQVSACY